MDEGIEMSYEVGEKIYEIRTVHIEALDINKLMPMLRNIYEEMCDYHERRITDRLHIKNYINRTIAISLSKADMDLVMKMLL